jgi:peptidyl-prolyl cis-trans isomerase B (cyclophilin B)
LDGQYAAFGKVVEGMDVVDEIASVAVDNSDRPTIPVRIKSVTVQDEELLPPDILTTD